MFSDLTGDSDNITPQTIPQEALPPNLNFL